MEQYKLLKKKKTKTPKTTLGAEGNLFPSTCGSQIANTPFSNFARLQLVSFPVSPISKPKTHHNLSPLKQ